MAVRFISGVQKYNFCTPYETFRSAETDREWEEAGSGSDFEKQEPLFARSAKLSVWHSYTLFNAMSWHQTSP